MKLISYEIKNNRLYLVEEGDIDGKPELFRSILSPLDEVPHGINHTWTDEQRQACRDALDNLPLGI